VFEKDQNHWVNVVTTNPAGIGRAKKLNLVPSGLSDVIVTSYAYEITTLFDSSHKGHFFTVLRHPIDRAVSMFNYLAYAEWEPHYDRSYKDMTLEQYAKSRFVENNWLTRFLSGHHAGPLADEDYEIAKAVLGSKFLIGLLSELDVSLNRFMEYNGWSDRGIEHAGCVKKFLTDGVNKNPDIKRQRAAKGSDVHNLLQSQNHYDIMLYEFAEELFKKQSTVSSVTDTLT
jgi:hypothetical protein